MLKSSESISSSYIFLESILISFCANFIKSSVEVNQLCYKILKTYLNQILTNLVIAMNSIMDNSILHNS